MYSKIASNIVQYWPIEIGSMLKYSFRVGHQPFSSELEFYCQKLNGKTAWNHWHLHVLGLMHFLLLSFLVQAENNIARIVAQIPVAIRGRSHEKSHLRAR